MFRTGILALTLAVAAGVSSAGAQGFSFSYGFGDPYADPYYRPHSPRYYQGPVVVVPRQSPLPRVQVVAPEEVRANLRANGFANISRIRARGAVYEMTATDPDGNLVALAVSMYSGRIEAVNVLEAGYAPRAVPEAPPARRAAPAREPAPPKVAAAPKPKPKAAPAPQAREAPRAAAPVPPPAEPPTAEDLPAEQPQASSEGDPLVVY
jgi:hypothetical protein